jgi:hypothetical protein
VDRCRRVVAIGDRQGEEEQIHVRGARENEGSSLPDCSGAGGATAVDGSVGRRFVQCARVKVWRETAGLVVSVSLLSPSRALCGVEPGQELHATWGRQTFYDPRFSVMKKSNFISKKILPTFFFCGER